MGKRGYQLKSQARYLGRPYAGELKFEYLPEDRLTDTSREGVSWQHSHNFPRNVVAQVDYNRVSDDLYFVDLASQVKQVSVGNLPQDAHVTHAGSFGRAPYSLQARVQRFQTLQDLADRAATTGCPVNFSGPGDLGAFDTAAPLEYVRFDHPTLVEGSRASMTPTAALPLLAPGWFFTPKVGLRYANYSLSLDEPAKSPEVAIPWGSLDSGLVFERDSGFFGAGSAQTIEPRLFYVYIPYRNQDAIPLFDTALADINFAQFFTENRFVGGDRFGDANQLTLALTTRLLDANGQEGLRATVAQRYYFEDERVGLTPTSPLRKSTESDILASVGGRLARNWTFDVTAQYNRALQRGEKFNTAVSYRPQPAKVLNASYRFQREVLEQVDISGQWPLRPGWYGVGRYNYSIRDDKLLEGLAGIEYNAGCWVFRAVVARIQAAAQVSSTAFVFQIEFNGIGAFGTDEVVGLLKRNVPGYSVTNPADSQFAPPSARPRLPFDQVY
jgi:LPS-assembly protein